MKKLLFVGIGLLWMFVSSAQEEVLGKWLTQNKDAVIEIYSKNGKYYGKVVKLIPAKNKDGSEFLDQHNPDKSLRNRTILGIDCILGFKWDADSKVLVDGKVYDASDGEFYEGKIWGEDGQLKMRGYVSIFFRTETWTRVR